MTSFFATMLAESDQAEQFGLCLNPKLKKALEAELRFPAKSSGPFTEFRGDDPDVIPFPGRSLEDKKRQA